MLSTVALGVVAVATPTIVMLLVRRARADGLSMKDLGALAIVVAMGSLLLLLLDAVLGQVGGEDQPVRRSSTPAGRLRRIVAGPIEGSLLGSGTLAGWTSTRVDGSLVDLEQPTPPAQPAQRTWSRPCAAPTRQRAPVPPPPIPSAAVVSLAIPAIPATPAIPGASLPPAPGPTPPARSHVVRHGETWWSLAELYLGDGGRASLLKQVNAGRPQPDGSVVDHKRPLRAGWTVEIPLSEEAGR